MTATAHAFVAKARSQDGARYVYGAKEPVTDANPKVHGGAFDCSGLTQWAADRVGGYLPAGSSAQYAHCKAHGKLIAVDVALRVKGALLFRGVDGADHVAISCGDGENTIEARGAAYGTNEFPNAAYGAWSGAGLVPDMTYDPPLPTWFRRTLFLGMSGSDVVAAKAALRLRGYGKGIKPGQRFGLNMRASVQAFRRARGMTVNGRIDDTVARKLGGWTR